MCVNNEKFTYIPTTANVYTYIYDTMYKARQNIKYQNNNNNKP